MFVLPLLAVPNFSHARTPVQQFNELYVQGLIERLVPLIRIYEYTISNTKHTQYDQKAALYIILCHIV